MLINSDLMNKSKLLKKYDFDHIVYNIGGQI